MGRKKKINRYWNFKVLNEETDEHELTLEGEMTDSRPTDWWTGNAIAGCFICNDEFNEEWQNHKNASKLTVKVNSPGGDLYTGMAIRNKLAEYQGDLTIVNMGIMASAASLLATLGNATVKGYVGSVFMIHGVLGFLSGYYNKKDLKEYVKNFDAFDKSLAKMYSEKMNMSEDQIKSAIDKESYYVGEEAIENGLCDEIIETKNAELEIEVDENNDDEEDKQDSLKINGVQRYFRNGSTTLLNKVDESKVKRVHKNIKRKEKTIMNKDELIATYPQLIDEIVSERCADAVAQERKRLQEIERIENSIADKELVKQAKFGEKPKSAQELAYEAMTVANDQGKAFLGKREEQAKEVNKLPGAEVVNADPQVAKKENEAQQVSSAIESFNLLKGGVK